jgi:hypothetical protein
MEPIDDLADLIRDSYKIICEYDEILQTTSDPRERLRCEREKEEQWALIRGYLESYYAMCQSLVKPASPDIRQIASHFPQFLALDLRQAMATLHRVAPDSGEALDQLAQVLRELGRFHEHLNEWKDLHNLLQESLNALMPLKGELEATLEKPKSWKKATGIRLWGPCRTKLTSLESFAENIKHIDQPFRRAGGAMQGPRWMVGIATNRDELSIRLKEGDLDAILDATSELWDTCYNFLEQADKRLRDMVGELYGFSNAILRSVEADDHHG